MAQAKVLTEKEVKKIYKLIDSKRHSSRNRCMFSFSTLCGMRISEIAALRIQDVLAADGSIKSEVYLSAHQTKGSKGRTVYLSEKMQQEVLRYLQSRFHLKDLIAVTYRDTNRALFATQKDCHRGFSASTACQMFHYWFKEARISGASSHSGRRSYLTAMCEAGINVRLIQVIAGHQDLSTTQKYLEVNPALIRKAVEMF